MSKQMKYLEVERKISDGYLVLRMICGAILVAELELLVSLKLELMEDVLLMLVEDVVGGGGGGLYGGTYP